MASMVLSKRVPLCSLLEKLLVASSSASSVSPLRLASAAVAGGGRRYNTGTQLRDYDGEESEGGRGRDYVAVDDRRRGRDLASPGFLADVLDPFFPQRSMSRLLNMMDLMENQLAATGRGTGAMRRGWNAKEDEEALYLHVDMPGLGKEHVKIWAEQDSLVIKGEGEKEFDEDEAGPRYSTRISLPSEGYKMDQIKAEMKNGVLKVVVPKVKEDERKNVFQVNVN